MSEVVAIRDALERFREMTVAELAAVVHSDARSVRRLLATDEVSVFVRQTGEKFGGSTIIKFVKPKAATPASSGQPKRTFTDDDVIRMWEMYSDDGKPLTAIAREFHAAPRTIERELVELGVMEKAVLPPPGPPRIDPHDPFKGVDADERIRRENIMAALAKVGMPGDEPIVRHSRHLTYARSLPHVKAGVRKRIPQSEHQRRMDRLGSGPWATIVRLDLRRSGLLPSYH